MPTNEKPSEPVAATIAELREAIPDASADFYVDQLSKQATVSQAKDAYLDVLRETVKAQETAADEEQKRHDAEVAAAKAEAKAKQGGVPAIGTTPNPSQDWANPRAEWLAKIKEKTDAGIPKSRAVSIVNKENEGLRMAMIEQVNA